MAQSKTINGKGSSLPWCSPRVSISTENNICQFVCLCIYKKILVYARIRPYTLILNIVITGLNNVRINHLMKVDDPCNPNFKSNLIFYNTIS